MANNKEVLPEVLPEDASRIDLEFPPVIVLLCIYPTVGGSVVLQFTKTEDQDASTNQKKVAEYLISGIQNILGPGVEEMLGAAKSEGN